jgi:hypothetical protein
MNTREENVAEMKREADEIERKQQVRRADLDWARQWHDGCARCPTCGRTELGVVDLEAEGQLRYESMSCKGCGARWKVEYRESAVAILREDTDHDDDWIELAIDPLRFSDREAATILAALRYWRREGTPSAGHERDIETDIDRLQAISAEEIETLCKRIEQSRNAADVANLETGHEVSR